MNAEWHRLIELAAEQALSLPAVERLRLLKDPEHWAPSVQEANHLQSEVIEVLAFLDRDSLWGGLRGLPSVEPAVTTLTKGGVLELSDLALIRAWCLVAESWIQLPREELRGERLRKSITNLPDPTFVIRRLDKILTPEGELSERASPRISSLFSDIRGLKRQIDEAMDRTVKAWGAQGVLQDNYSDVRDGRYVVPVKISNQSAVDGIIHESSASRATVFIEPREVAILNNKLRLAQSDLAQEIYRLMEEVSKELAPQSHEFITIETILTRWDAIQAKARVGRRFGGKPVQVTEEREFIIHNTAHPLLWLSLKPEQIIRNQVEFGDPTRTLLITGPNTGGKTVLLKTLAFAAAGARTGIPLPAAGTPTIPFFDSVFMDLGDPQSIEEHLSSFSGHVLRFKEILAKMTERSLVLIDELNSATDPEEGAALGRAFLETLMESGAMIVATTHDPSLKALAITDQRILNASMEFDESSSMPTYRIALGVPGRSRALETAERLGLPAGLLARARSYLSQSHRAFESVLAKLESDVRETERARKEAVAAREEAEKLKREWLSKTESAVGEAMERTKARLKRVLEGAQDEVRAIVRKLDEKRSHKEVDELRGKLNAIIQESLGHTDKALAQESPEIADALAKAEAEKKGNESVAVAKATAPEIEVGSQVRVPKWKSIGIVLDIQNGKFKVAMGNLTLTLMRGDIEPVDKPKPKTGKVTISGSDATGGYAPPASIDLRGKRFDEAMSELEAYLDLAYRSKAQLEVTIIHGLGTGAIREGARKLLAKLPYIKEYRDGGPGQGGAGATICELEV